MAVSLTTIKVGGDILRSPTLGPLCSDIAKLSKQGEQVVIVHGGGPQATALQAQLGQTPNIVAGRRITDADALEVMKMAVAGGLNMDLCSALLAAGANPVGLHGASSQAIAASKRPPTVVSGGGDAAIDFGFVGDVTGINKELLSTLLGAGYVPVLACIGSDSAGQVYNINADIIANQAAKHLGADRLVLVTSAPGVVRDLSDLSTRIPKMTVGQAREAIADGTVVGGMIPKLEESIRVLEDGSVAAIHIVGDLEEGDLRREMQDPGSVGTALLP
ncbi:MAG: acetylglutamate kinase [Myxococcales bacterium]|nr:acetylglutamate kinase [Myxococcales bacterium]